MLQYEVVKQTDKHTHTCIPSLSHSTRKAPPKEYLWSPRAAAAEETEDRKRQNEAVFKAWLQQKNKQAALAKK